MYDSPITHDAPASARTAEMARVLNEYSTPQPDPTRDLYQQAQRRVKAKMGFYTHLTTYMLVNALLVAIYLLTTVSVGHFYHPWFIWPLCGWGIGLVSHGLSVFVNTAGAQQRMVQAEMRRMGL